MLEQTRLRLDTSPPERFVNCLSSALMRLAEVSILVAMEEILIFIFRYGNGAVSAVAMHALRRRVITLASEALDKYKKSLVALCYVSCLIPRREWPNELKGERWGNPKTV